DGAAQQKADARRRPDGSDAGGAAVKDLFTEQREQNLGSAASHSPSHRDQRNPHHQRDGTYVGQTFVKIVPGGDVMLARCVLGAEAFGYGNLPDSPGGKSKRQRIDDKGPMVAQAGGAESGEQRARG